MPFRAWTVICRTPLLGGRCRYQPTSKDGRHSERLRQALPPAKRITENDYEQLTPEGDEKNLLRARC